MNALIKILILINILKITFLKAYNFKRFFFIKINLIKTKIENINKKNYLLISKMRFKKKMKKLLNLIF